VVGRRSQDAVPERAGRRRSLEAQRSLFDDGLRERDGLRRCARLGFTPADIDWIPNTVFENAFKPGPKDFDFHLAQISIRPGRAQRVDFSDPYFDANQSVIAMTKTSDGSPNPILSVTTIAGLKPFKLGAATETTSLELIQNVIQPDQQPSVFNDNTAP